jgi:hypothetical protein
VNRTDAARNSMPKSRSLVDCCAAFILLGSVLAALLAAIGYLTKGSAGAVSALAAVGVCLAAELLACAIQVKFRDGPEMVFGALVGMFARMLIPLIACAAVAYRGGPLAENGFVYWMLAAYLVFLACHTLWFLPGANDPGTNDPGVGRTGN